MSNHAQLSVKLNLAIPLFWAVAITQRCPCEKEHKAKEERYWKWQNLIQGLLTFFTLCAFIAARAYAHFAHQQVAETRRANDIARQANKLNRDNAMVANRPWVGPVALDIDTVAAGRSPAVTMKTTNFGHSPALNIETRINGTVFPAEQLTAKNIIAFVGRLDSSTISTMFPDQTLGSNIPTIEINTTQMDQIAARRAYFVVLGCITYKDTLFTVEHHTWIFAVYAPDKNMLMLQRTAEQELPPDD